MAGRGEVRFRLVAEVEQVKSALNEVKSQISALGNEMAGRLGPAGSVLQAMGPAGMAAAAGLGASVAAAGAFANEMKRVIDVAGALNDLSAKVGITTQALQELGYAGSLVGVSQEAVIGAIGKAQVALSEGNAKTIEALDKLGLSLKALQGMAPEEQFRALAEAIQGIKNPTEQAGVAAAIFGKSFREVMPLIVSDFQGAAQEANAFGAVMSSSLIGAADQAGDNMTRLSTAFTGFKNEIAGVVVQMPEFQAGLQAVVDIMRSLIGLAQSNAGAVRAFFAPLAMAGEAARLAGGSSARSAAFAASAAHNAAIPQQQFDAGRMAGMAGAEKLERALAEALKEEEKQQKAAAKAAAEHQREIDKLKGTIRHTIDELMDMGPKTEEETIFNLLEGARQRTGAIQTGPAQLELSTLKQIDGLRELGRVIDQTTGLWTRYPDVVEQEVQNATEKVREHSGDIQSALGAAFENLPQTILSAIQGGGNVGQAIGASLLGGLGQDLGKKLAASIGGTLGKALGGLAGPLGSLAGSALGGLADKVFGKLFKSEGKKVNDMRDAFLASYGGFQELQKLLKQTTNEDLVKKVFDAKTVKEFEAAVKKVQDALGLHAEAQQKLNAAVEKYGFTIEELGPKFQQQKLDEMAGGLLEDFRLLTASGIDVNTVLTRMGPAFNEYVQTAMRAGQALPEAMRPMIEQLIQSGQLLDENGNAFTSVEQAGISFTQTLSEGLQSLISKIDELVRALTGAAGTASRIQVPGAGGDGEGLRGGKSTPASMESFADGSGGFRNFGSGTPAMLHGTEAVVRPQDMRSIGGPSVTYAPVITIQGAGNQAEIRDVLIRALRDNADGVRDYVASVRQ